MKPRKRPEEEMTRPPEPPTPDEQAEDLAPEDDQDDDTLGRPVQLER
jgi:hypothetical protein